MSTPSANIRLQKETTSVRWYHDTQDNDILYNDIQINDLLQYDIQHNDTQHYNILPNNNQQNKEKAQHSVEQRSASSGITMSVVFLLLY